MRGSWRYVGCVIGFGFGAVWVTAGLGSAILSLLCAAAGYCAAVMAERRRSAASARRRPRQTRRLDVEAIPLTAEGG